MILGIDASRSFGARPTGTEHYATEVTRRIAERSEHRVRLYFRQPPVEPTPERAELRILPAPRLWTHTRLAAELWARPPDLVFIPAHVMPVICRPPAVVTVHDLGYERFPSAHPWSRRAYLRWSTRRHLRHAARLLADSAATRDDLVALYGADPERIHVVHLAADPDLRPADGAAVDALRTRLGLPLAAPYLLHLGTLQPRKNLGRLLEAIASLVADHPTVQLVLAGMPGWSESELPDRARRLGLVGRVHLPGYLPREDLAALYSGAVGLALPSLYEGFGLTALEAMACGCPVACSDSSSLPEVVGEAALRFDPLDSQDIARALGRLLDDAELRDRLRRAGIARAAGFSWDRCAAESLAVLEACLSSQAARRGPA
ncbi:MAG: glycosyltransferase family 4 protein [Caldilineae bacterium]|nr:glycosyltransferase family 4 protein [Chloroflexota bacterium]MCB9177529.1 glycosyltransferase family 4 protein [Caldilineae bacterium]